MNSNDQAIKLFLMIRLLINILSTPSENSETIVKTSSINKIAYIDFRHTIKY
jgi:hypothetical protein